MKFMKNIAFLFLILAFAKTNAQQLNIIPKPNQMDFTNGEFDLLLLKDFLFNSNSKQLNEAYGDFSKEFKRKYKNKISTKLHSGLVLSDNTRLSNEAYRIDISQNVILISGSYKGLFYALQTLQQIFSQAKDNKIPCCTITDSPRFAYRGMHLDVARHFQPISFVKKYLDYMAMYKFNTFHWHLTDDQGWRIEIKKYPKLTSVGGWRNGTIVGRYPGTDNDNTKHGGYYTQAQIKEVVQYAADRNITVIPEIEMPGHASAAIAAYPELSCFPNEKTIIPNAFISTASKNSTGKLVQETWGVFEDVFAPTETTFNFLQNVLDEVMPLFPSKYIHIGGDECPKEAWKRSDFCQQLIKENNLKDEHGLQSYFIQRIEKYINNKGKNIIGWDEILEGGLASNATVMSWRGEKGGIEAAQQKHNVIMTPGTHCYFDHSQSKNEDSVTIGGYTSVEKVYDYEPIPKELNAQEAKYVLGAQSNLWTEYIKYPSKVEYMIFPRMLALSEVLWSKKEGRSWEEFEPRLLEQMKKLKNGGVTVSNVIYDPIVTIKQRDDFVGVDLYIKDKRACEYCAIVVKQELFKDSIFKGYHTAVIMKSKKVGSEEKFYSEDSTFYSIDTGRIIYYKGLHQPFDKRQINISSKITYSQGGHHYMGEAKYLFFNINKATGKKITLTMPPSKGYPGNGGAFGLVNGVVSEKGINSAEWLGFGEGQDAEMVIDLGKEQEVSSVKIHTLDQQGSWIYLPESMEILTSNDGVNFSSIAKSKNFTDDKNRMKFLEATFAKTTYRYIRVWVKNFGQIPSGQPDAGNQAWLFIDEVQVY
jgi:hexosaminidase